MSNFTTGLREITASIAFSQPRPTEISLTYCYQILWTGEDYEVTISAEPDETGQMDFIERSHWGTLAHCVEYVKRVLARDLAKSAENFVIFEEEI